MSPEAKATIDKAIEDIEGVLTFLIHLTDSERRKRFKMAEKRIGFAQKALEGAKANPDILPKKFDLAGFEEDVVLATELARIRLQIDQLRTKIDDTTLAVGSEALQGAAKVYRYVKTAAKDTPGLKPLAAELAVWFAKASEPDKTPRDGTS